MTEKEFDKSIAPDAIQVDEVSDGKRKFRERRNSRLIQQEEARRLAEAEAVTLVKEAEEPQGGHR